MRSKSGAMPFKNAAYYAARPFIITYTRKDSLGVIVRSFPAGTRRKAPQFRARCYAPPGQVEGAFVA